MRDVNRLNKALKQLKSRTSNITFPNLNKKQLSIRLYTDESFKNLPNGGSQGGQIILLRDNDQRSCPLAWNSARIKRVVRNTLAAETLSLADGASTATYLKAILSKIFPAMKNVPIDGVTDNQSLYDNLGTSHRTADKGLIIDICCIKEQVETNKLTVTWMPGSKQLSNVLTKQGAPSEPLRTVLRQGSLLLSDHKRI